MNGRHTPCQRCNRVTHTQTQRALLKKPAELLWSELKFLSFQKCKKKITVVG